MVCKQCGGKEKLKGDICSVCRAHREETQHNSKNTKNSKKIWKEKLADLDAYETQQKSDPVFDFVVNEEEQEIRITKFYDKKGRSRVKIPNFVTGVQATYDEEKDELEETPVFSEAKHLKELLLGSGVVDLSFFFWKCPLLSMDLSEWDVSKVRSLWGMFGKSQFLDVGDLGKWNVSQVTTM